MVSTMPKPARNRLTSSVKAPFVGLEKRTKRLDDATLVPTKLNPLSGEVIYAEKGGTNGLELTGDQKAELAQNLRDVPRRAFIERLAKEVLEQAHRFFDQEMWQHIPTGVITKGDKAVASWMSTEGFSFKQDGLTSIVMRQGKVVNQMTARIGERHAALVEAAIKQLQADGGRA
jgi:hypothetical protein